MLIRLYNFDFATFLWRSSKGSTKVISIYMFYVGLYSSRFIMKHFGAMVGNLSHEGIKIVCCFYCVCPFYQGMYFVMFYDGR